MFNIPEATETISRVVLNYFAVAKAEILEELYSPGYAEIVDSLSIANDLSSVVITFKKDLSIEGVDAIELLAQGGVIRKQEEGKELEFIKVPPSPVIRRYLGKR